MTNVRSILLASAASLVIAAAATPTMAADQVQAFLAARGKPAPVG